MQAELAGSVRGPTFAELTARMELDFELARTRAAPAALLRVEVERLERFTPEKKRRVLAAIGRHLAELAPPGGLVAACDGAELVVLLRESGVEQAEALARSWIAAARKLPVEGEAAPVRASLAIGVAATRAGLDAYFETLQAVARDGLDVARSNGGECCVHSELYEIHQRKVERVKGPRAPVAPPVKVAHAAPEPSTSSDAAVMRPPGAARPAPSPAATSPVAPVAAVPGLDLAAIEAKVLELARAAFARELAEREKRFQEEIAHYERRLAKTQRALAETEDEKERIARMKGLDTGVASIYRDVQGLSADERDFERKHGLLQAIAESNLELHEQLKRRTA